MDYDDSGSERFLPGTGHSRDAGLGVGAVNVRRGGARRGSLPLCIRLMVTVNTDKSQREMRHVYLNEASQLRPDLSTS